MLDCLIIGDSIAVGTHQFKQECAAIAKGGINSWQWNKNYLKNRPTDLGAEAVIISLGTNDHSGVNTFKELHYMRGRVNAKRVYWIMPPCNDKFCKNDVNDIVKIIANAYGDTIIGTQRLQKDAIHPSWAGYKELADAVK
jgi:lysophospholipase L1-like esterase